MCRKIVTIGRKISWTGIESNGSDERRARMGRKVGIGSQIRTLPKHLGHPQ